MPTVPRRRKSSLFTDRRLGAGYGPRLPLAVSVHGTASGRNDLLENRKGKTMTSAIIVKFYNGPAEQARAAGHCARGLIADTIRTTWNGDLIVTWCDRDPAGDANKVTTIPAANVESLEYRLLG